MGNAAVIGELAGINDLEDLYQLDASENSPEGEDEDEDDEDDAQPDEIPHEAQPGEIPHE
jgi:hypothetical protein